MTQPALTPWSTQAVNLPEHATNPIHTDAGAKAAGFDGALVAGVTTYAYLTHVPAVGWGLDWLRHGSASVRFRNPVLDAQRVECEVAGNEVSATVNGIQCATATFALGATVDAERVGEALEPIEFELDSSWSDYGERGGDDCALYREHQIAHPASWPRIANEFFHAQLVTGPWIHVRSHIVHAGIASVGAEISARANVIERFDSRAGRRAIADVRIEANGELVASIQHEAIIELSTP